MSLVGLRRRGFTLIEMMIAGGMFALLGVMVFAAMKYGIIEFGGGNVGIEAQQNMRTMMDKIKNELATGARMNVLSTSNPPAVLRPQPNSTTIQNEAVFFGANQSAAAMDTSNINNFRLVRYVAVNLQGITADPPNALIREEYSLRLNGLVIDGITPTTTGANPDFTLDYTRMTRTRQDVLVSLKPKPASRVGDQLSFTVSHAALDYRTYNIDVSVTQYLNGDPTRKVTTKQMHSSVTLADMM